MGSLSASFEANRHVRLPAAAQVKNSLRDFLIVDWHVSDAPPRVQRMAVIFDRDRDERILDFLSALHFRNPQIRANIIAVAESGGEIAVYYGDPATYEFARRPMIEAAHAATKPTDCWTVAQPELVPTINGQLDRDNLNPHSLLHAVPARFQLGLIEVAK